MKLIKNLKFAVLAALAALAVAVLFQTSITRAGEKGKKGDHGKQGGDKEKGDRDNCNAKVTFTKFVTAVVNQPGLISTMTGAGEGDAGDVLFTGNVLKGSNSPLPPAGVVAVYNFTGSEHSFTALINGFQAVAGIGQKGVIVGVVIDGWLKGHALEGEWTVIAPCYAPGTGVGNCFEVTLEIQRESKD